MVRLREQVPLTKLGEPCYTVWPIHTHVKWSPMYSSVVLFAIYNSIYIRYEEKWVLR